MAARPVILTCVFVAVLAAALWVWRLSTAQPAGEFRDFPWTFITEAAMSADPAHVLIDRGTIEGPLTIVDPTTGDTAWPAFIHPDPAVVPLVDGKPLIIPLIHEGQFGRTPVIPALKRPLSRAEIEGLRRYFTPEGTERMAVFRKGMGL